MLYASPVNQKLMEGFSLGCTIWVEEPAKLIYFCVDFWSIQHTNKALQLQTCIEGRSLSFPGTASASIITRHKCIQGLIITRHECLKAFTLTACSMSNMCASSWLRVRSKSGIATLPLECVREITINFYNLLFELLLWRTTLSAKYSVSSALVRTSERKSFREIFWIKVVCFTW